MHTVLGPAAPAVRAAETLASIRTDFRDRLLLTTDLDPVALDSLMDDFDDAQRALVDAVLSSLDRVTARATAARTATQDVLVALARTPDTVPVTWTADPS